MTVSVRTRHELGIKQLSEVQAGVISHSQAEERGLTGSAIHRRIQSGTWRRIHRGVFSTWPGPLSTLARVWAALLYAGPDAVASHQTAAWLDGFGDPPTLIHISVAQPRHLRGLPGVRIYRSTWLARHTHPAKSPPRTRVDETVLDLVEQAGSVDDIVATVTRACRARLTSPDRIAAAADGRSRLKWRAELAIVLADVSEGAQAVLEGRYLVRVERAHGLPQGTRQYSIRRGLRTEYKDVYYDDPFLVVVELDGPVGHSRDDDRRRDLGRDNADTLAGRIVLRYGPYDVSHRPCEVAAEVARALRNRGWRGLLRACGRDCGAVYSQNRDQGLGVPDFGIASPRS